MKEVKVGGMAEDLSKIECFPVDLERNLISILRSTKRKSKINKIFESMN